MPEPAQPRHVTRAYAVAELVVPIDRTVLVDIKTPAAEKPKLCRKSDGGAWTAEAKTPKTNEDQLIQLITNTIAPMSWAAMGGQGTVEYFPMTMSLVVNQTPDIQEQVADLLAALRRLQEVEVSLEIRLVSVVDGVMERLGVDFNVNPKTDKNALECERLDVCPSACPKVSDQNPSPPPAGSEKGVVFLKEEQLKQWLETLQGDVMQAPKLTLFNGQTAKIDIGETQYFVTGVEAIDNGGQKTFVPKNEPKKMGFRLTAQPIVSPDRRSVQLNLHLEHTELASAMVPLFPVPVVVRPTFEGGFITGKPVVFTQFIQQPVFNVQAMEKNLTIPVGQTAILGGLKRVIETRNEFGPPVVSKIPYVNRLFKNVGYGREVRNFLVLVTPRVIVEEEEGQVAGKGPCSEGGQRLCPGACKVKMAPRCLEESEDLTAQSGTEEENAPRYAGGYRVPSKAAVQRRAKLVADLLNAYDAACASHDDTEAEKLAKAALLLDPTCFRRDRSR